MPKTWHRGSFEILQKLLGNFEIMVKQWVVLTFISNQKCPALSLCHAMLLSSRWCHGHCCSNGGRLFNGEQKHQCSTGRSMRMRQVRTFSETTQARRSRQNRRGRRIFCVIGNTEEGGGWQKRTRGFGSITIPLSNNSSKEQFL